MDKLLGLENKLTTKRELDGTLLDTHAVRPRIIHPGQETNHNKRKTRETTEQSGSVWFGVGNHYVYGFSQQGSRMGKEWVCKSNPDPLSGNKGFPDVWVSNTYF